MGSPLALLPVPGIQRATQLVTSPQPGHGWQLASLSGRLSELSGMGATAMLTLAFDVVLDAQQSDEPCAWITTQQSAFFPPDAAARGVDLDALVVVRTTHLRSLGRTADHLARSGAFGLIIVDLASMQPHANSPITKLDPLPMPLQSRLLGLAQTHDTAVVFLTRKHAEDASLNPLISLRVEARRIARPDGSHVCEAHVLKDKRHAPGWRQLEVYSGPAGLR